MNDIKLALLHYFPDAETETDLALGMKAVCGQVMTTPASGELYLPGGLCPVCSAVLERIN